MDHYLSNLGRGLKFCENNKQIIFCKFTSVKSTKKSLRGFRFIQRSAGDVIHLKIAKWQNKVSIDLKKELKEIRLK